MPKFYKKLKLPKFYKKPKLPRLFIFKKYSNSINYEQFANQNFPDFFLQQDLNFYFNSLNPLNLLNAKHFKKIRSSIKLWNPILKFKFSFLNNLIFFSKINFFKIKSNSKKIWFRNRWGRNKSFLNFPLKLRLTVKDINYYQYSTYFFIWKYFQPKWKKYKLKYKLLFSKIIYSEFKFLYFFICVSSLIKKKKIWEFWSYRKVWIIWTLKKILFFKDPFFSFEEDKKIKLNWNLLYYLYLNIGENQIVQFMKNWTTILKTDIIEKIRLLTWDHSNNFNYLTLNITFLILIENVFSLNKFKFNQQNFWINFLFLIYVLILSKFNIRWKYKWFLGSIFLNLQNFYTYYFINNNLLKYNYLTSTQFWFTGLEWNAKRYLKKILEWKYVYTWFFYLNYKKKYFLQKNILFLTWKRTFTRKTFLLTKNFSMKSLWLHKSFLLKYLNKRRRLDVEKFTWYKAEINHSLFYNFFAKNFFFYNKFIHQSLYLSLVQVLRFYKRYWKLNFFKTIWKTLNFFSFPLTLDINLSLVTNTYINLDVLTTIKSFNFFSTFSFFHSLLLLKLLKRKKKWWKFKKKNLFFFNSFSIWKWFFFSKFYNIYKLFEKSFLKNRKFYRIRQDEDLYIKNIFKKYSKNPIMSKAYYCEFIHLYLEFGFIEYEKSIQTLLKFTISELKLTALTDFLQAMYRKKKNPGNIWNSPAFTDLDEYFLYYKWGMEFELFKFTRYLVSRWYFGLPDKIISNNLIKEKFLYINQLNFENQSLSKNLENSTFQYSNNFFKKLLSNDNKMLELFRLHFSLVISIVWDSYRSKWLQLEYFLDTSNYKPYWEKNDIFDFIYTVLYWFLIWRYFSRHFIKWKLPKKLWLGEYFFSKVLSLYNDKKFSYDTLVLKSFFNVVIMKLHRIQKFNLQKFTTDYYTYDQLRYTIFKSYKSFFLPTSKSLTHSVMINALNQNYFLATKSIFFDYLETSFLKHKNFLSLIKSVITLKPFFIQEYYFFQYSYKKIPSLIFYNCKDENFLQPFFFYSTVLNWSETYYFNILKNIFISFLNNIFCEFFFEQFIIFFNNIKFKLNSTSSNLANDSYPSQFSSKLYSYHLFSFFNKELLSNSVSLKPNYYIYIHTEFIDFLNINFHHLLIRINLLIKFHFFSSNIFKSIFEKNISINIYFYFYKVQLFFFWSFMKDEYFRDDFLNLLMKNLNYQCFRHYKTTNPKFQFWNSMFLSFYQNEYFYPTKLFLYNFIVELYKNILK